MTNYIGFTSICMFCFYICNYPINLRSCQCTKPWLVINICIPQQFEDSWPTYFLMRCHLSYWKNKIIPISYISHSCCIPWPSFANSKTKNMEEHTYNKNIMKSLFAIVWFTTDFNIWKLNCFVTSMHSYMFHAMANHGKRYSIFNTAE